MAERKAIGKQMRFEIFKRDGFKCQYCGRSAPDVLLEIDHIIPVAEGGDNSSMNLVTSCQDCNRGKGKRKLSDKATISKQKAELENLNQRREQLEMMAEWRKELRAFKSSLTTEAIEEIKRVSGMDYFDQSLTTKLECWIDEFGIDTVMEAIPISYAKYFHAYSYHGVSRWREAFYKIGGIIHNKKLASENGMKTFSLKISNLDYEFLKTEVGIEVKDGMLVGEICVPYMKYLKERKGKS